MKILLFLILVAAVVFGLVVTQWGMPSGVAYCNSVVRLDFGSQTTGKIRYLHVPDFKNVAICGDICSVEQCPNCPPKEWICEDEER